jgi:cholesterol transport system auxiliary component
MKWLLLTLLLSGCALLSKSEPLDIRYFTPEKVKAQLTSATERPTASDARILELGRVTSGSHLREKIAFRDASWEVGYYEDRRWTEPPEAFVRRELGRTLFEERGFRRSIVAASAPTLEIELIAFEEIRGKPTHAARVQLRMILHDGRGVLHEETITVDKPLAGNVSTTESLVAAIADALEAASSLVADRAERVLGSRALSGDGRRDRIRDRTPHGRRGRRGTDPSFGQATGIALSAREVSTN